MAYQSEYTGTDIDKGISLALAMYPVGSIYLSVNNVNPGTIFGGTWEQIQDRFLLAAGSTYAGGATGGTASHTHTSAAHTHTTAGHALTVNEMPSHQHALQFYVHNGANNGNVARYGIPYAFNGSSYTLTNPSGEVQWGITAAGGSASHSHGNTGSTTPGATGSSSNLPPYLAIYVWKRTA